MKTNHVVVKKDVITPPHLPCGHLPARGEENDVSLLHLREKVAKGRMRGYLHGFTLIELLVVVLIIGILAAVALPQYNKAVKKAQGREVLVAVDAFDKAQAQYFLEYGTYKKSGQISLHQEDLGIEIPRLQYFKYRDLYGNLVSQFVASNPGTTGFKVTFEKDSLTVSAEWIDGKIANYTCTGSEECSTYFDCTWKNNNLYPGDTSKTCVLN